MILILSLLTTVLLNCSNLPFNDSISPSEPLFTAPQHHQRRQHSFTPSRVSPFGNIFQFGKSSRLISSGKRYYNLLSGSRDTCLVSGSPTEFEPKCYQLSVLFINSAGSLSIRAPLLFINHHHSYSAPAFYHCPFYWLFTAGDISTSD